MPLLPALGLVFIILKLTQVIAWSWLWVLSPLWIGALLWFAIVFLVIWLNGGDSHNNYFRHYMRGRRK